MTVHSLSIITNIPAIADRPAREVTTLVALIPAGFSPSFAHAIAKAICAIAWMGAKTKNRGAKTRYVYSDAINITFS